MDPPTSLVAFLIFPLWYPFRARFHQNPDSKNAKTKAEKAFNSLGVLGTGLAMHNGCNDTVFQMIAFLVFMLMKEPDWITWFAKKEDLPPISYDWVPSVFYQRNIAMAPIPQPKPKWKGKGRANGRGGRPQRQKQVKSNQIVPLI